MKEEIEHRDTVKFILKSMRKFTLLIGNAAHTGMIGNRLVQHSWEFRLNKEIFYYYPFPAMEKSHQRQAEFCSQLIRNTRDPVDIQNVIVLTNSDYIVDRTRLEIIRGNIATEDVALLHFAWNDDGSLMRSKIDIDDLGNIINAPPNYREFELAEQLDLIGVENHNRQVPNDAHRNQGRRKIKPRSDNKERCCYNCDLFDKKKPCVWVSDLLFWRMVVKCGKLIICHKEIDVRMHSCRHYQVRPKKKVDFKKINKVWRLHSIGRQK